jgi:hypothetical protein
VDNTVSTDTPLHTRTEFSFTVDAAFDQVAPLFGANEERKWAADWNPQFVYPIPARDEQGMVFTVPKGQFTSVWVSTAFDLEAGHIQYAYLVSETMTTLIDIHLTRISVQKTGVSVVYERTALVPEANEHVQHFANEDAGAGKEWGDAINAYFAKLRK